MDLIKVEFKSNLDEFQGQQWPRYLCCQPEIGHSVQSADGRVLKIVNITHCGGEGNQHPFLKIDLHFR